MEKERLEILLSNILGELHEKTFDCNSEEFINYLRTEIGITNSEIDNLCKSGLFPKDAEQYFINECIKFCIEFEDKNSTNCLSSEGLDDKYRLEPVTITEAAHQISDVQLDSICHDRFNINTSIDSINNTINKKK